MSEVSFAASLLGRVLVRARDTLGRSPEQVGSVVGVSGRTIRRLEDAQGGKPRRVTLDSLAAFYGLNAAFIGKLASWSEHPAGEVRELLAEWAVDVIGEDARGLAEFDPEELAMRLSRAAPGQSSSEHTRSAGGATQLSRFLSSATSAKERDDVLALVTTYIALDATRQRLVRDVALDLRRAQQAERQGVVLDLD